MAVTLSATAADYVKRQLEVNAAAQALRIGVKKSGCSGFAYTLAFEAEAPTADDQVFQSHGVCVVVDAESLAVIDGTEVDYVTQGLNSSFKFRNPNVTDECGCGESFAVS